MKIAIFGTGYVGLVTGVCLAEVGNTVHCVDVNAARVAELNNGVCPIFEPGLPEILQKVRHNNNIIFSTDAERAIKDSQLIFIAVGTPSGDDGAADLQYVQQVARTIGKYINDYKVIINKSTVPVGTADLVREAIGTGDFDVVSNPEFLKEGCAVNDFKKPDRIIIGTDSKQAIRLLQELYAPFNYNRRKIMIMSTRSAELAKYAANAMLATKISFINEISNIAEAVGADIEEVREGIGSDPRIGYQFIYPGCGYGGSCFPKDVTALINIAAQHNYKSEMLEATHNINNRQKQVISKKILKHYGNNIANKKFAIWGGAFKPNTDDIRAAPSIEVIQGLLDRNAQITLYDPAASKNIAKIFPNITIVDTKEVALKDIDALIILTEWQEFRSPNFTALSKLIRDKVIFDGRNLYDPAILAKNNIKYYCIGRSQKKI